MAIFSPLRSRRLAARQSKNQVQMITFRLRQEWFALPIRSVVKVIPLGQVYGDPQNTGISLTIYQEQELLVIDVAHRIFDEEPTQEPINDQNQQHFLLIVQDSSQQLVGLPIDSIPEIRRVSESIFKPLPETYLNQGKIRCISSMMIEQTDKPPVFLLNPDQLTVSSSL